MTPEQQRIAIAQACGWTDIKPHSWHPRKGELWGSRKVIRNMIPDYLNDLNAMHDAEKILDANQWDSYRKNLAREWTTNDDDGMWAAINTTAAQRAEAFLKTLNLWTP